MLLLTNWVTSGGRPPLLLLGVLISEVGPLSLFHPVRSNITDCCDALMQRAPSLCHALRSRFLSSPQSCEGHTTISSTSWVVAGAPRSTGKPPRIQAGKAGESWGEEAGSTWLSGLSCLPVAGCVFVAVSLCEGSCSHCSADSREAQEAECRAHSHAASEWYVLGWRPAVSERPVKDLRRKTGNARDSYTCQVLSMFKILVEIVHWPKQGCPELQYLLLVGLMPSQCIKIRHLVP